MKRTLLAGVVTALLAVGVVAAPASAFGNGGVRNCSGSTPWGNLKANVQGKWELTPPGHKGSIYRGADPNVTTRSRVADSTGGGSWIAFAEWHLNVLPVTCSSYGR